MEIVVTIVIVNFYGSLFYSYYFSVAVATTIVVDVVAND